MRIKRIGYFSVAILLASCAIACSKQGKSGWFLDASFSNLLVSFREEVPIITKEDPISTVDALQIFRTKKGKDALFTVDDIRSQELDYETTNPAEISSLFLATRRTSKDICDITESEFVFFILAFDRDLMRVGLLKYFPCNSNELGYYQKWGSSAVYFSAELATLINRNIPSALQRTQARTEAK